MLAAYDTVSSDEQCEAYLIQIIVVHSKHDIDPQTLVLALVPGNKAIGGSDLKKLKICVLKLIQCAVVDQLPQLGGVHHAVRRKPHRKVGMDIVKTHTDMTLLQGRWVHRRNNLVHHPCQVQSSGRVLEPCDVACAVCKNLDGDVVVLDSGTDLDTVGKARHVHLQMCTDMVLVQIQNLFRRGQGLVDALRRLFGHIKLLDGQHDVGDVDARRADIDTRSIQSVRLSRRQFDISVLGIQEDIVLPYERLYFLVVQDPGFDACWMRLHIPRWHSARACSSPRVCSRSLAFCVSCRTFYHIEQHLVRQEGHLRYLLTPKVPKHKGG